MANNKYYASAKTNGKAVVRAITQKFRRLDEYGERILEEACKLFVEKAKRRLVDSKYNVANLVDNIYYQKYGKGKYRVGIKNNNDKAIMYFLEFGTGVVGEDEPHELAGRVGWEYNKNKTAEDWSSEDSYIPTGFNSIGEFVGYRGWWFVDDGIIRFTSGLKAVSYLYDTLKYDMDWIIEEAKRRVNGTN